MSQATQEIKAALAQDMTPQSAEHKFRFWIGTALVAAAIFIVVTLVLRNQPLTRDMLILIALFSVSGLGVMFTGSVVALLRAVPVPWRKNGNGT